MTSATEPVLECIGLTKSYDGAVAVDDLHLSVEPGEIFGILGTNGAGKTTTVECAQGLRRPDGGRVRVLGADPLTEQHRLRGRVGSQLQHAALPERLTVQESVRLFADSADRASRSIEEWDLGPIAKAPFAGLSGGQKQRLFLALALLNDPEVVFLDELTQGLDPNARTEVWRLIERVRDRGATVVLVTHFMNEAEALCDRIAVMRDGRLVDLDTPAGLIARHGGGVRMRFDGAAEDVDWVAGLTDVHDARFDRGEVEVRGTPPMIVRIGAELVARDRIPRDVRVSQPDLEDALVHLLDTEGALR